MRFLIAAIDSSDDLPTVVASQRTTASQGCYVKTETIDANDATNVAADQQVAAVKPWRAEGYPAPEAQEFLVEFNKWMRANYCSVPARRRKAKVAALAAEIVALWGRDQDEAEGWADLMVKTSPPKSTR